jgi:hypothetical protein
MTVSLAMEEGAILFETGFRFAFAVSTKSYGIEPSKDEQWEGRRRKLEEGVWYNRWFVPTYHGVIFGIIFIISVAHWTGEFTRWRKRRATRPNSWRRETDALYNDERPKSAQAFLAPNAIAQDSLEVSTNSSRSSMIDGPSSPLPKEQNGEEIPLLNHGKFRAPLGILSYALSSFKAAMMYQPGPLPVLNKVLPPNGTSLAIVCFIGLNMFYVFYRISLEVQGWWIVSDRAAILFTVNLPYLYILGAKNQPLKILTGRSYESLNLFHRRLGELLCLLALFHAVTMMASWYFFMRPHGYGLIWFLTQRFIIFGLITFTTYELLYFTSLASFRQRWYELFLGSHVILQVLALVFLYLHFPTGRPYVLAALAIYLTDRVVYRLVLKRTTIDAHATIMEDDETVRLSFDVNLKRSRSMFNPFRRSIKNGWKAANHVFITVPSLAPQHRLQAHPFTIASRAPTSDEDEAQLVLLIRARDGFSADLLMRARSHKQMSARLDGPYGSSHARRVLDHSDLAIMVAGGTGIAVLWPLVHHLLDIAQCTDNETAPALQLKKQKIVIIWIIHKGEHIEWVGRRALADAENRGAEIIVPRATEEVGRPDLEDIIQKITGTGGGARAKNSKEKIGVVASGPDSMGRQVRNICASMIGIGLDIDVTVEKFGW